MNSEILKALSKDDLLALILAQQVQTGVVQRVLAPGYTEGRRSRDGKGITRLESYPELNHAKKTVRQPG